ncbi:unnamed protein product [Rotaria sp. Silwood1]|nr:unnamed protein product [Rotaria sp. Silwood1]CAF1393365.1 unnamed protein product [Rotaria sp. Silwood1]CAF3544015.1 unnamed protein product [Rotaria sp. Silwood1]CAF3601761.1 unnamed protein product [Rotaria sp. Silwood1]CAF3606948.1 unnamed protein product [Rotaria sp. Silwood1]
MNSQYDCFVPMTYEEAMVDDEDNAEEVSFMEANVQLLVEHVPVPPNGYTFSNKQRQKQQQFFQKLSSNGNSGRLWSPIDLYHAAVIAVLPENCSSLLREVIECLLVTYAEIKLNMFNLRTTDIQQLYGPPYEGIWCEGVKQPFLHAP